jgi:hypothetical protein
MFGFEKKSKKKVKKNNLDFVFFKNQCPIFFSILDLKQKKEEKNFCHSK